MDTDASEVGRLAERLRSFRTAANLTQVQVAEILGVKQPTISKYECGGREPSGVWLRALASLYGVTLEELVGSDADA